MLAHQLFPAAFKEPRPFFRWITSQWNVLALLNEETSLPVLAVMRVWGCDRWYVAGLLERIVWAPAFRRYSTCCASQKAEKKINLVYFQTRTRTKQCQQHQPLCVKVVERKTTLTQKAQVTYSRPVVQREIKLPSRPDSTSHSGNHLSLKIGLQMLTRNTVYLKVQLT